MALQPSQWPIGVRTFRNLAVSRAGNHLVFGMTQGFAATHAGNHPVFGMAHDSLAARAGKSPRFLDASPARIAWLAGWRYPAAAAGSWLVM